MFQHKSTLIVLGLLGLGMMAGIICLAAWTTDDSTAAGQDSAPSTSNKPAGRQPLLDVTRGQIPSDIGSDSRDNVKMTTEECAELGGKALKVVIASPDSFGDRQARVTDWTGFECLQFDVFNPGRENVPLTLTIKHGRSTSFGTRIDVPVVLTPGKSSIRLPIDRLVNVNGSAPDLTKIRKWYFALESPQAPTFYLGNLWLVKEGAPASAGMAPAPAPAPRTTKAQPAGREPLLDVARGSNPQRYRQRPHRQRQDDDRGLRGTRRKGSESGLRQSR